MFVAKLDKSGNWRWVTGGGSFFNERANQIKVDTTGNVFVTGYSNSGFFAGKKFTAKGGNDVFVAKLDTNGNWLWTASGGGKNSDSANGIALEKSGDIYITGRMGSSATFGTTNLTTTKGSSIFVAKLNKNGQWLWAKNAGGALNNRGYGVAVDSKSNVVVVGNFQEKASFGSTTLNAQGTQDVFVAKLDSTGKWLWAKRAGGLDADEGHVVTTDASDNIYIGGYFTGAATFGTTNTKTKEYTNNLFVSKMDVNGTFLSTKYVSRSPDDDGQNLVQGLISSGSGLYVGGTFAVEGTFDQTTLKSTGSSDIFLWFTSF